MPTRRRHSPHRARTLGALITYAATLAACREPAVGAFPILVRADTGSNQPVEGVRVWAAGRDLGSTAAHGALRATLAGREGERIPLTVACPPAHRTDTPVRHVPLRRVKRGSEPAPLDVSVRCEPTRRQVALVVRAEGARTHALPVEVQERRVGQTDASGVAHILIEDRPGTTLRVRVVTSEHPTLQPRDPVQTFRVADEDSVLLFAQVFVEARPKARRATHARERAPGAALPVASRPYRIE